MITTLNGHVIVEPVKPEAVSKGGIVLPDVVEDESYLSRGKVVEVSPTYFYDGKDHTQVAKEGDIVLYYKQGSLEFNYMGQKFVSVPGHELIAVIG